MRRSRMKSSGCLFLPMAMRSTAITQTFLSRRRSRKKLCSFSTSDGREHWPRAWGWRSRSQMRAPEQTVDAQAVARKLDGTILFYSLGPKKSWLWAITAHHTRLFPLPAQSEIETQVHGYQNAILQIERPTAGGKPGREESLRNSRRASRSNDSQGLQGPDHSRWRPERS